MSESREYYSRSEPYGDVYISEEVLEMIAGAAAINDAVEIAKKYEDEKVVSFINGILGAFVRAEFPEQGRPKATSDPKEA